jgi:metal-responsive CopG/Arc/MetJ family transcriptional regulator|tara:strand:+ start:11597 stop:11728 length:132 start_codon:yes stop_codon:yes gene_type:complete
MPNVNISLSNEVIALVDEQAKKELRNRSAHIAELIKAEEKRKR